jgi:hypothetical protein
MNPTIDAGMNPREIENKEALKKIATLLDMLS